jgi:hypothetical protein
VIEKHLKLQKLEEFILPFFSIIHLTLCFLILYTSMVMIKKLEGKVEKFKPNTGRKSTTAV